MTECCSASGQRPTHIRAITCPLDGLLGGIPVHLLLALQRRLAKQRTTRSGLLLAYTIVVVFIAVLLDKILEEVPAAILVSLAATGLLDKRAIAPRLGHQPSE